MIDENLKRPGTPEIEVEIIVEEDVDVRATFAKLSLKQSYLGEGQTLFPNDSMHKISTKTSQHKMLLYESYFR